MDINSLPSNSHKSREKEKQQYSKPPKDLTPVVSEKAYVRKKSGIVRLADVFLPEDVESVKEYIIRDILIPKIKYGIHDIVSEAWDSFCGISGRRSSGNGASRVSFVSYDKKYQNGQSNEGQPRRSSSMSYDEIYFKDRGNAESVFDRMGELCEEYGNVSVADMYEIAEVPNDNFALYKIGWTSMEGAQIQRMNGGEFRIKMPKARPFD